MLEETVTLLISLAFLWLGFLPCNDALPQSHQTGRLYPHCHGYDRPQCPAQIAALAFLGALAGNGSILLKLFSWRMTMLCMI